MFKDLIIFSNVSALAKVMPCSMLLRFLGEISEKVENVKRIKLNKEGKTIFDSETELIYNNDGTIQRTSERPDEMYSLYKKITTDYYNDMPTRIERQMYHGKKEV